MGRQTYYEVLGVSVGASDADIRKAYYNLALRYHPDKSKEADATVQFQRISQAYQVLSDKGRRGDYDKYGTVPERFQDASMNFRQFVNEFMMRWNVGEEVTTMVNDTLSNIRPGRDGFVDMIQQLDKNKLLSNGLQMAQKYIANRRAVMEERLRQERIDRLPVNAWRYEIDLDTSPDDIIIGVDIPRQIAYSHIELVFMKTGEAPKQLVQFVDFDAELSLRVWEREITVAFVLRELGQLSRIGDLDLIIRDQVNPCQLSEPFEWSLECGAIRKEAVMMVDESMIFRIDGEGLRDWLTGRRGRLWVCFSVNIRAPVRRRIERIDDAAGRSVLHSLRFENILSVL